jgi:hypothetical protein
MAKWIKIALWWLIIKLFLAVDGMIRRSRMMGGVASELITRHPPPSSDEIERVLREQIAQRRRIEAIEAAKEKFYYEECDDEFYD